MAGWTEAMMPAIGGRRALVTGGTSGLGLAIAIALARRGAQVLITARDPAKGEAALTRIRRATPDAHMAALPLDLASLHSVRTLAALLNEDGQDLHLLINNAGIMGVPTRRETVDGFELQMGTNHLGHFALTGLLLPLLLQAEAGASPGRIVTVASLAHRNAAIDPADLSWRKGYDPFRAYNTSKLANLLFARELQKRLRASNKRAISVAAHPGLSATAIGEGGPRLAGGGMRGVIAQKMATLVLGLFGQNAARGAWPILQAATDPAITGFAYLGPQRMGEMRGPSGPARMSATAQDDALAARLWTASVAATGVGYDALGA